jgi:hypothetical protein
MFDAEFIEYLENFKFTGEIYAIPEGTIVFPQEPLVRVKAPITQAQFVETALLNIINHQSLIATKAARVVWAAEGDPVMEFGLRRAQGPDAGILGARAAMIAGCIGTSNVLTGKLFDVPVKGTHAHSWIMSFPSELEAFRTYAEYYPNSCILLVDTYNTLEQGVPNAIKAFKEAEEYNGVSIIIAYAPCIAQGILKGMSNSIEEEKLATKVGYFPIFRRNPETQEFKLDSEADFDGYMDFLLGENRYKSLKKLNPEKANQLYEQNKKNAIERYEFYKSMDNTKE